MKADLHIHTFYSKHASGTLEECVCAAIKNNVNILAFTDHAPFIFDQQNRLSLYELEFYLDQIAVLQQRYQKQIKILSGLEIDYTPEAVEYLTRLLKNHNIDFSIGSVHFLLNKNQQINIWDIEKLSCEKVFVQYFENIKSMISTGFFDAVGHFESILRGGMDFDLFLENTQEIIPFMQKYKIAVELNSSLLHKEVFDTNRKTRIMSPNLFNNSSYLKLLSDNKIPFTTGSDAHNPSEIGRDITEMCFLVRSVNGTLVYFEKHSPKQLDVKNG